MKKIFALLISVILLFSFMTVSVSAEGGGVLKAARVTANPGDEITIPVNYVNNPGVYVIRVTVAYDSRAVELVDITNSASKQFNYTINSETEGSVVVLMDAQKVANVTGDIELFSIKFKIKSDAAPGRALFPVYCEEGMATAITKVDGKIDTVSVSPDTSTGSVTILCKEHSFDQQMTDGSTQCSKCGAIKAADGNVSVDTDAGLPEIDISSASSGESPASSENSKDNSSVGDGSSESDGGNKDGGLKIGHFIPIVAAVIIVLVICVIVVIKKKKSSE